MMPFPLKSVYAERSAAIAFPPLTEATRCEVAVIGGGLTGLAAALELAQAGRDVVVLEAGIVGGGASGRNGGQIVTGYAVSQHQIARWIGGDGAQRLWDLAERGKALLTERVSRLGIDCALSRGFVYAAVKPRHVQEVAALQEEWVASGYTESRVLDRAAMRALVSSERYVGGLWDGGGGQLDPLAYVRGLAAAASAAGVRIFEHSRVRRLERASVPLRLDTPGGRVEAEHVIIAGNALLGWLVPDLAATIVPISAGVIATEPLGENRGRSLIPGNVPVSDLNLVLDYFRLTPDWRLLFGGAVSYAGFEGPAVTLSMRQRMRRVFPALDDVRVTHAWDGRIDLSLTRMLQIGRLGERVFYAQGFSGHGVALTQTAGHVLAEGVQGRTADLALFERIPQRRFAGGRGLRRVVFAAAMGLARLRDRF